MPVDGPGRRKRIEVGAIALLFASVLIPTLPRLARLVRQANELRPLSRTARRERLFGDFYRSAMRVDAAIPKSERLAIVLGADFGGDLDTALFFNYFVYPRRTRIFSSLADYRANIRDPQLPKRIVHIDTLRSPEARIMSYEAIRAEEMIGRPVVRDVALSGAGVGSFFVPIAVSLDGPPPDSYTTEAILEADRDTVVVLSFHPMQLRKEIPLKAGERRSFHDVVYECFGRMDAGWLEVESRGAPVRAAFWFVNRGANAAAPLPLLDAPMKPPLVLKGKGKVWLLNATAGDVEATVNGTPQHLGPRALISLPAAAENRIEASGPLYAFLSDYQPGGETRFVWP